MLEIQSFVSLKNESLLIWTRAHFKGGGGGGGGGGRTSQKFGGGGGGGGGARQKGMRSIFRGGADTLEDTLVRLVRD